MTTYRDNLERAANRVLTRLSLECGGLSDRALRAKLLDRKWILVRDFRALAQDGEDVSHFPDVLEKQLREIIVGETTQ